MSKKSLVIEGYALLFRVQYSMGSYIESIAPEALDTADLSDVRLLRDHNASLLLGRNSAGTLKLQVDKTGLFFRAALPDSALARETLDLVARRDLNNCSWGFFTGEKDSSWTYVDGVPHRTIRKVSKIYDVSLCTFPANPHTKAWHRPDLEAVRSIDGERPPEIESYESVLQTITAQKQLQLV